jgi:DNA-binding transcriptional regulator GbsR (MarR family)
MGSFWGIGPSLSRIHALLIVSEEPICLDEIAARLGISKSSASTCLKELRTWRVVHRVVVPGDRREFYVTESDAWKMFFNILAERKRREFDPILESVRQAVQEAGPKGKGLAVERLQDMERMLATMDRLAEAIIGGRDKALAVVATLSGKR